MAINTIKATIQMRRGLERDFDTDKMTAGEWAVSTDSKKVWMCFAPGLVRRMATYEAFEEDMRIIQQILATCQDIQEAVEAFEALAEKHKNDAANSAQSASGSASAAGISETNAAGSATSAARSAQSAAGSATEAKDSQDAAKVSEDNAAASAAEAGKSEEAAAGSAQSAAGSATDASTSAGEAAVSAGEAEDYSLMSKSYAIGTEGQVRPGDPTDNSKYYSELAQYLTDEAAKLLDQAQKLISAATAGALIPSGTVAYENLPTEPKVGYMYNISNAFVTDDRFAEGHGIQYNPGANVYWTADGQWDVMIGVQVTGVKGAAESFYRQGNVNLTPTDIGLGKVPNVTTNDQTPTFTQAATRENIASGNKLSVIFGKIMKWFADLKSVAFSGSYNDLSDKPTTLKNPAALTFTGAVTGSYDGSAAKSVAIPAAATVAPKVAGTAAVGTGTTWARADHVHPVQTSVTGASGSCTGNAATATKLATARTIDGVSFNGSAAITHYGTCSTVAATAAKVVACTGFTLVTGAAIRVKFTVTNTAASPTLNVNSTGARAIYYRGAAITVSYLAANRTYEFVYNGAQYELIGDINTDTNTTYSAMTGATASAAGKIGLVPAPAAGKQASFLRGDGTWVVPTNTTYSAFTGATASAAGKASLVPAPASNVLNAFLRSNGTWFRVAASYDSVETTWAYKGVVVFYRNTLGIAMVFVDGLNDIPNGTTTEICTIPSLYLPAYTFTFDYEWGGCRLRMHVQANGKLLIYNYLQMSAGGLHNATPRFMYLTNIIG